MRGLAGVLVVALGIPPAGCKDKPAPPGPHETAPATRPIDAPPVEVASRPLGLADLASYGWRKRAGHAAFRAARTAEHAEDWNTVVVQCAKALAADPTHLEAAWLYAAGLAKLGKPAAEIVKPLQLAEAGDFGKWGPASLELDAFAAFLATPLGVAWRERVDADRNAYAAALAHAVIVVAGGDLYAYEPDGPRWYRLTRTYGAVIGAIAFPDARLVAYLTRDKQTLSLGTIDLARGHTTRPMPLGALFPVEIAAGTKPGVWVLANKTWRIYADGKLTPAPAKATRPPGPYLENTKAGVALHRGRPKDISADWDEQSLASAIKIGTSNRVVSVPSPGLVDGSTIAWSPDHAHLAFLAQLDDPCTAKVTTPLVAAFVADAATGTIQELERAQHGLAIEWVNDRKLAVAGDQGVALVDLDNTRTPLAGARALLTPLHLPRCATGATPTPAPPDVDDDPDSPDVGDEPPR